jgi:hypothetical protein
MSREYDGRRKQLPAPSHPGGVIVCAAKSREPVEAEWLEFPSQAGQIKSA